MSQPHSHSGNGQPGGHGDGMNLKKIIAVGATSLAVFAVGIVWAYNLMTGWKAELHAAGDPRDPGELGKDEIGIVDQVMFEKDHRLENWKSDHAKRLGGYGWVDRGKGIAHIPIEQAMERVIAAPPNIPGEGLPPVAAPPAVPAAPASPPPAAAVPRPSGGKP